MPFVLGITGGVGTGKSTVLKLFGELGALTLSADDIAHKLIEKDSPAYREIVSRFGDGVLTSDGLIDRAALGRLVFSDANARRDLERITHPRIIAEIGEMIAQFRKTSAADAKSVLAVEIPLLLEVGMEDIVDEVLVVAAEQETQLDRLTTRSGIVREDALRRIESQMPLKTKIEHADRVIWNDGSLDSLRASVRRIWEQILLL